MKSLARWCYLHRRIVLVIWVVALIGMGTISSVTGVHYKDDFKLPNTESKKALDLLQTSFPQQSGETDQIVVHAKSGTLQDPAIKSQVTDMLGRVAKLPYVSGVSSFYDAKDQGSVSKDETIAFANLQLAISGSKQVPVPDVKNIISTAQSIDSSSIQVELGGGTIESANQPNLGATELVGIAAAAVILFIAFGSIFTMFLPLLTAVLALGSSVSVIGFLTHGISVANFAPSLAALIGIGVGTDYALFIVSRHRTNLQRGLAIEESVVKAIDTSGRSVVFAGITVCIGLLGLLVLRVTFLYGLAYACVVAVLFTMLASLTFLPAMLGFVGIKALSKKQRAAIQASDNNSLSHEEMSPGWYRWAQTVQRHSIILGTLALAALIVLSLPTLHIRLGSTDSGGDPEGTTTRKAYDLLATGFGPGFNGPLQLAAELNSPSDLTTFTALGDQVKDQPDVAFVSAPQVSPSGKAALAIVYPKSTPQDKKTTSLITALRKHVIPPAEQGSTLKTYVGGQTAIFQDFSNVLAGKLPVFIGAVVLLAFILLMAVFRSLLIPLTASIMNILAAGAGFGVIVAVFQWGWLGDVFGVSRPGPIQAFLPNMVFAILFGLSMDYEVFLVSRMHEEWIHTNNNEEAISLGQAETGRVITAAAAIMVFVFGSFIFGGDPTVELFGLGLASAILIDALIIRTILVPSIMHILGRSNWYLPKWLDRILPQLSVEAPSSLEAPRA